MMRGISSTRTFLLIAVTVATFFIASVENVGNKGYRKRSRGLEGEPPKAYPNAQWESDPTCEKFPVQLALQGTFQTRPVVGYHGAGSARLMDLITAASGYYSGVLKYDHLEVHRIGRGGGGGGGGGPSVSGEVNGEKSRMKPGFWNVADPTNGRTLLQFSIYNGNNLVNQEKKPLDYNSKELAKEFGGILLIRNPWDSFASFRLATTRRDRTVAKGNLKKTDFSTEAKKFALGWVKFAKAWISKSEPNGLLVVQYENLIENPRSEVVRIMEYLEIPVSEERLDCLEQYLPLRLPKLEPKKKPADSIRSIFGGLHKVNNFLQRSIKGINKDLGNSGIALDYQAPTAALRSGKRRANAPKKNLQKRRRNLKRVG